MKQTLKYDFHKKLLHGLKPFIYTNENDMPERAKGNHVVSVSTRRTLTTNMNSSFTGFVLMLRREMAAAGDSNRDFQNRWGTLLIIPRATDPYGGRCCGVVMARLTHACRNERRRALDAQARDYSYWTPPPPRRMALYDYNYLSSPGLRALSLFCSPTGSLRVMAKSFPW